MYLEQIKKKLGSTNAKVHTGGSTAVTRLKRKTGVPIKRTKHAMGGPALSDRYHTMRKNVPFTALMEPTTRKTGGPIKRKKHAIGGMEGMDAGNVPYSSMMTPAPAVSKMPHKKGKRVKREHHFLGALLGAASAIPSLIDLFRKR
jgi:hypothetical protein